MKPTRHNADLTLTCCRHHAALVPTCGCCRSILQPEAAKWAASGCMSNLTC